MQVDVIENAEQFTAIQSNWLSVYEGDPHAHFFLSWPWLATVLDHLNDGWRILAVRDSVRESEQYVAFFPVRVGLYKSKRHGVLCNEYLMPGRAFWADYTGFLCLPDHEATAIPAMGAALKKMHWSQLDLEHLRVPQHRLDLLLQAFDSDTFRVEHRPRGKNRDDIDNDICPAVELAEDFDTFLADNLSSGTRMKLRRAMRQVENDDNLRVTESTPQTFERDVDILVALWREMWSERKGEKIEGLARRYRTILLKALKNDLLYLPILWSGDKPVAALGNYIDRQKKVMYVKTTGRDRDWKKPPSGFVLHGHSIRWAIANGMKRYDFMRGDEAYKYHYGSVDTRIENILVRTRSRTNLNDKLDPASIADAMTRAARYEVESRPDDAILVYQQVLDSFEDNVTAMTHFGGFLVRIGRLPSALKVLHRLVKVHPDHVDGWQVLGDAHLALREFDKAEAAFRRAIALSPSLNSHFCLGCALQFQGRSDEAESELAAVLDFDATNPKESQLQDNARKLRQQLVGG